MLKTPEVLIHSSEAFICLLVSFVFLFLFSGVIFFIHLFGGLGICIN